MSQIGTSIGTESRLEVARGWGGDGNELQMAKRHVMEVTETSETGVQWWLHHSVHLLKIHEVNTVSQFDATQNISQYKILNTPWRAEEEKASSSLGQLTREHSELIRLLNVVVRCCRGDGRSGGFPMRAEGQGMIWVFSNKK